MQIFDILDPKLDVMQSRFLEASAGTGKTFAIENLMVRLIQKGMQLPEILAVTFTREAAHEMKTRIRKKLEEKNMSEALLIFDEIQIYTIHGFCHRMLTEFAFEAKSSMQMGSEDSPDHLKEMRQVVEDFFRTAPKEFGIEITLLLKRARYDVRRLINYIVNAMQSFVEPIDVTLAEYPIVSFEQIESDFHQFSPRYKFFKPEKFEPQLQKFSTFLEEQNPAILLEEKTWFFEKMHEGNVRVKAAPVATPTIFDELHRCLSPYLQIARDPDQMMRRISKECLKRWNTKANRTDQFTFDDLLHKMQRALSHESFLIKVQSKYKAAIIDEFQDTDPIQWDIFQNLFLKNHLIYLVGDPKQSIYGFRNADIYTYMNAAKTLGEETKAYLDTNYRSSPKLIEALNQLFTKNPGWLKLPTLNGALDYHPVKPGRKEGKLDEEPITYFSVEASQGRERSWPTKSIEAGQLFPYITSEILRHSSKIPLSEMAILVKDRFQGMRMQLFLNKWNIASTLLRTFNLAESYGFLMIETLIKCALEPENTSLIHSVFPGENPFIGSPKEFPELFAELIDRFAYSPTLYKEMRQTAELLLQKRGTLLELYHYLQELKASTPEENENLKLLPDEATDSVPIMTTFASKGLEFDVVFALGLCSRHLTKEIDEEKEAEKMRQLYVAFTRPKEKLYIPTLIDLDQNTLSSPIELFFGSDVPKNPITTPNLYLYKNKTEKSIPKPKIPGPFHFEKTYLTSFSAMATTQHDPLLFEKYLAQDLSKKTLHTLLLGAETGVVIHALFENHFQGLNTPLEQIVLETLSGTHLEGWEEILLNMMESILKTPLINKFKLSDLKQGDYFQEMEFLFPKDNQLVKGFADLVFKIEDTFYILDWKTNWLGQSDEDYNQENLQKAMEAHDYFLQADLYLEALRRYVKRLYKDPHFGGAYYVFLRGKGVYHIN